MAGASGHFPTGLLVGWSMTFPCSWFRGICALQFWQVRFERGSLLVEGVGRSLRKSSLPDKKEKRQGGKISYIVMWWCDNGSAAAILQLRGKVLPRGVTEEKWQGPRWQVGPLNWSRDCSDFLLIKIVKLLWLKSPSVRKNQLQPKLY